MNIKDYPITWLRVLRKDYIDSTGEDEKMLRKDINHAFGWDYKHKESIIREFDAITTDDPTADDREAVNERFNTINDSDMLVDYIGPKLPVYPELWDEVKYIVEAAYRETIKFPFENIVKTEYVRTILDGFSPIGRDANEVLIWSGVLDKYKEEHPQNSISSVSRAELEHIIEEAETDQYKCAYDYDGKFSEITGVPTWDQLKELAERELKHLNTVRKVALGKDSEIRNRGNN